MSVHITVQIDDDDDDDENASKRVGLLHRLRLWAWLDYAYGLHFDMLPYSAFYRG